MFRYYKIRRHTEPVDEKRIDDADELNGHCIAGGYREFLTLYGLGYIVSDIALMPPESLLPRTREYRRTIPDHLDMPNGIESRIMKAAVMVATASQGESYWCHPDLGQALLLYGEQEGRCWLCPHGFGDIRVAFSINEIALINYPAPLFDSRLNCSEVQYSCDIPRELINVIAEKAFRMWFSAGDIVIGGTDNADHMTAYLSGLGGYIHFQGHGDSMRPNLVTVSYDVSVENEVAAYGNIINKLGFRRCL